MTKKCMTPHCTKQLSMANAGGTTASGKIVSQTVRKSLYKIRTLGYITQTSITSENHHSKISPLQAQLRVI